ncbi:vitamin D3 hydroxylase-associated protein-like isoform X2 [Mauremys mutica]|uniref:vitamin D3 hydroxylase-associated protein-like isoform X2 n=1 Tax=Mauremys mutica TaxID=74926 RepID=UPI001D162E57|nr:vitamin D3 hydroxylase-associated protein-like isoform X2 [Mauremys mutica]
MIPEKMRQLLPEVELDPSVISVLLCSSTVAFLVLKWMVKKLVQQKMWEARRNRVRALGQMEEAVQQFKQENPEVQASRILSLPLVELVKKLKEDSLSPESVLYTYMDKALEVNRDVNCVTDFIQECVHLLQEVRTQREKGLLYGVPISIKDPIGYEGHVSTCGLGQYLGYPEREDSVLVKVLKKQGAIPFVKTNISQCLINYDCSNLIFGQTVNPLNHKKSPGGSSGGEGALIAGGGSVLGFGTDIGGSIRLPSSFCGLCGLKPTGNRLSGPVSYVQTVTGMVGPMARDVDSLALCMRALLCDDMFRLDPTVPPLPFNEAVYSSSTPLRIGYYDTDGYFLLPPCMRRAVHETRTLLQEVGHTLIPFVPPRIDYVMNELFMKGLFADGGAALLEKFELDTVDPNSCSQINCYRLPFLLKKILAFLTKPLFPRFSSYLNALCGVWSPKEFSELHAALMIYRREFLSGWRNLDLDVILCPVLGPAFTLGYPGRLIAAVSSTMLYNVLNFPAGVVPVTTVTEADEENLKHYTGHYGDPWDRRLRQAVEGAVGLPVAVQCVALPWQEELCLRFMKEVERLAQGQKKQTEENLQHGGAQADVHTEGQSDVQAQASRTTVQTNILMDVQRTLAQTDLVADVQTDVQKPGSQTDLLADVQLHGHPQSSGPDMQPGVQTQLTQPDTETQPCQPETQTQPSQPDVQTQLTQPEVQPDVQTQLTQPEVQPDVQTQPSQPDVQTQLTQPEVQPDVQTQPSQPDMQPDVQTQLTQPDIQPDVQTQPTQPDIEIQPTQPDVHTQPSQSDVQTQPDIETQPSHPDMQPDVPTA